MRILVYHWAGKYRCIYIKGGEMLFKKGDGGFSARSIEGFKAGVWSISLRDGEDRSSRTAVRAGAFRSRRKTTAFFLQNPVPERAGNLPAPYQVLSSD